MPREERKRGGIFWPTYANIRKSYVPCRENSYGLPTVERAARSTIWLTRSLSSSASARM
jgi:hypothetical protein